VPTTAVAIRNRVDNMEADEVEDTLVRLLERQVADPSTMFFPPMLPVELAMRAVGTLDATVQQICEAHQVTRQQLGTLVVHPVFVKAYQEAIEMLKVEGMSFKTKAKMQAEDYLGTAFAMVKNPNVTDAVRADLIKNTVRWAGLDAKAVDVGAGGNNFSIQINLG
jgi:hypothetical protein